MKRIHFLIIMFCLCGQSFADTSPLPLGEKSKIAISKLSTEELCESTEDENFKTQRNICTSWETNSRGYRKSCLEWGSRVNKQNYIQEFKKRNYPKNKCSLMEQQKKIKKQNEIATSRKKCQTNPPSDTLGMKLCSGIELNHSENNLNLMYSNLTDVLDNIYSNGEGPPPSESLSESQKYWEDYREHQCQIFNRVHHGGSAAGLLYNGCRLNITKQRIKELSDMYNEWAQRGY